MCTCSQLQAGVCSVRKLCTWLMHQVPSALFIVAETDIGSWVAIVGFDCRGLEPVGFHAENGWKVITTGGTMFEDVDLREEWADYCEKAQESVGVYSIEGRFVRCK